MTAIGKDERFVRVGSVSSLMQKSAVPLCCAVTVRNPAYC